MHYDPNLKAAMDRMFERNNRTFHEQMRRRMYEDADSIFSRPKPAPEPEPRPKGILVHQRRDVHNAAVVEVHVPNIFGRHEPLLDGETGLPVNFARELGDPRQWLRDRTADIQKIVDRAALTCGALLKGRLPQC